jgi:preprotein translocase subunit SecD
VVELKRFDVGASRGMRRLRLGLTAALLSLLAIAALAFTLGLVEDPALRYRVDLS